MEGASGPSELELNKERLAALKDEHQHLCYEMKKREFLHSSSYCKIQQQIRQQWAKIEDLKKQKSELTLQLRLQESESFSNKGNKNLEKFLKLLDEMVRLENYVKEQTEELEKYNRKISDVDKKIRQKQREIIKVNQTKDRILKCQKNISFLENRLNSCLTKYNQLLVDNNCIREEINSLLQTQATFRKQYSSIKHLISLGKKTISEVVNSATTSYQTGESVKYKLNLLQERTQVDQKKLEEKIKELQLLIEQDKQLKEFIEFKGKDRSDLRESDELELKTNQIVDQKLQDCHAMLARIQLAAGCKDVNRICKTYIQQEESNTILFGKVNSLNVEIESLHEEVEKERRELDFISRKHKEQQRKDMAEKYDIDSVTDQLRMEAQRLEDDADMKASELEQVRQTLQRIYKYLDHISTQNVSFTVDETVTDDNVLLYLEAIEKRILDLIECQKFLEKKKCRKSVHFKDNCSKKFTYSVTGNDGMASSKSKFTSTVKNEDEIADFSYNRASLEAFAKNSCKKKHTCSPERSI